MPTSNASQNKNSHFAPYFDYLDQTNAVVPLIMPLTSHDAHAGSNGISWPKQSCWMFFWSFWPNKWNGGIDDTVEIMLHWQQHQGHQVTKMFCGATDNEIGITCCWCLCNTVKWLKGQVASHFDKHGWTNAMVLLIMPLVSCEASGGITLWPESHIALCYNHIALTNKMMALTMTSVSCDAQQHHKVKKVMSHLVWIFFT